MIIPFYKGKEQRKECRNYKCKPLIVKITAKILASGVHGVTEKFIKNDQEGDG